MVAYAVVAIALLLAAFGKLLVLALVETFPDFWAPLSRLFGPAIIVARVTAFGALFCTAVLFVTMSRSLHRGVHGCCSALEPSSRSARNASSVAAAAGSTATFTLGAANSSVPGGFCAVHVSQSRFVSKTPAHANSPRASPAELARAAHVAR